MSQTALCSPVNLVLVNAEKVASDSHSDAAKESQRSVARSSVDGWDLVPLGLLLDFKNGVNTDKSAYGQGIPFINVLEPITRSRLAHGDIPGLVSLPKATIEDYRVFRGDIVFNRTSETAEELGLAAVYLDDAAVVFGGFVIRGRPKTDKITHSFSEYAFRTPYVREQIVSRGQGVVRANIGQSDLKSVLVQVPPKPEQEAIAQALGEADALIAALDRLIAKKRDIKQATLQALLSGRTRLPGFSGRWQERRLGDVAQAHSGGTPPTSVAAYYDGEIPWVSITDISRAGKYIRSTSRNLTRLGVANSAAQLFPEGTVLYAMYASLGKCCLAVEPVTTSQAILGIRTGDELDSEFLYYKFLSMQAEVEKMGQQGTQSNLSAQIVRHFTLSLPDRDEQRAIAHVLGAIDDEIAALERHSHKATEIKQGTMQELLTGRTRLA